MILCSGSSRPRSRSRPRRPPRAQTGDSVTGRIQVRTSASTVLDVSFDAHSGPSESCRAAR